MLTPVSIGLDSNTPKVQKQVLASNPYQVSFVIKWANLIDASDKKIALPSLMFPILVKSLVSNLRTLFLLYHRVQTILGLLRGITRHSIT